jgi:cytoskeletal protein RodZ
MTSQPGAQPGWNTPQQYSMQPPKKSSKTWVWVVLILGVVVLLCGGGFAGLVFIGMQAENNKTNLATNKTAPPPVSNKSSNTFSASNSTTTQSSTTSTRTDLETVDLAPWVKEFSAYGNTEFTNGEFIMSSKKKGFYYVLVAPEEYKSEKADTRVTLRNVDNATGSLGYGLIFHSNPTPLQQGYAFLIDTKRKKYRVVHHLPQDEKSVVTWTTSTAIREGAEENTLEARDLDDKIELYINGTMVTSIKNLYGYAGGVPGLYAGDGVKVAFKNLEIRK